MTELDLVLNVMVVVNGSVELVLLEMVELLINNLGFPIFSGILNVLCDFELHRLFAGWHFFNVLDVKVPLMLEIFVS
jgi:hypothetical protein